MKFWIDTRQEIFLNSRRTFTLGRSSSSPSASCWHSLWKLFWCSPSSYYSLFQFPDMQTKSDTTWGLHNDFHREKQEPENRTESIKTILAEEQEEKKKKKKLLHQLNDWLTDLTSQETCIRICAKEPQILRSEEATRGANTEHYGIVSHQPTIHCRTGTRNIVALCPEPSISRRIETDELWSGSTWTGTGSSCALRLLLIGDNLFTEFAQIKCSGQELPDSKDVTFSAATWAN